MGNTKSTEKEVSTSSKPSKKKVNTSSRNSLSSQGNRRPVLTANQRIIIKYCLDNAKDDIADRILRRVIEKREDFRQFLDNLSKAQRVENTDALKMFLFKICENLTDSEEITRLSEEFGCCHVQFRAQGFKPDYFACTADAVTTECTFLDQATHTASETAGAWSQLSAFVFSAVRDGYYAELRKQRKSSNAFRNRASFDVVSTDDGTASISSTRRSNSPQEDPKDDDSRKSRSTSAEPSGGNFLLPPQVY